MYGLGNAGYATLAMPRWLCHGGYATLAMLGFACRGTSHGFELLCGSWESNQGLAKSKPGDAAKQIDRFCVCFYFNSFVKMFFPPNFHENFSSCDLT